MPHRVIIETPLFTRIISELMSDDVYRELQDALIQQPDKGDLIPGSGGLRKVRWKLQGQGRRGGVRVIYHWVVADEQLRMLYAYAKSQQENLTPDQLAILRKIVERWTS
ncbi:MAG: type II toxin-antitoxin system RelE/ParE family toxin [Candidatus Contendobacter sp.]|nr:type II toxin-antitoxin system RelE/ParE family toxin [Candidatus Contendobacter sp.]MDS4057013.1 type II toxin-antitoxin system RelE/ParE family toxin [Candidatus Contendobacter sp.]